MDIRELERLYLELRIRRCQMDPMFWITKGTKTLDEQDPAKPNKPFPSKRYLKLVLDFLNHCPRVKKALPKSRTMMMSWEVSAWTAHFGFTHPGMCTVFQSADEDRAIHDVGYVKTLWRNSFPELRARWPAKKDPDLQPAHEFELLNRSRWIALTGNPQKIRSEHPTIIVYDEAAHWEEYETGLNVGVGCDPLHIISLSSANPGYFADVCEDARVMTWPDYQDERPAELKQLERIWKQCGFPDAELELAA